MVPCQAEQRQDQIHILSTLIHLFLKSLLLEAIPFAKDFTDISDSCSAKIQLESSNVTLRAPLM